MILNFGAASHDSRDPNETGLGVDQSKSELFFFPARLVTMAILIWRMAAIHAAKSRLELRAGNLSQSFGFEDSRNNCHSWAASFCNFK